VFSDDGMHRLRPEHPGGQDGADEGQRHADGQAHDGQVQHEEAGEPKGRGDGLADAHEGRKQPRRGADRARDGREYGGTVGIVLGHGEAVEHDAMQSQPLALSATTTDSLASSLGLVASTARSNLVSSQMTARPVAHRP
jgi:hypothetical protein